MYSRFYAKIGALALMGLTGGCAFHRDHNPHNDVMVFATHTKFGIDVSAPLNSATLPQFNFGYNRAEAVWMPLKPSGLASDSKSLDQSMADIASALTSCDRQMLSHISDVTDRNRACLASVVPNGKYVSMASGVDPKTGGQKLELDTYSVFASFGARGSLSGSETSGGLAQIFATGIAAQRLAANPQVGAALNTAQPIAAIAQAKVEEQRLKSITQDCGESTASTAALNARLRKLLTDDQAKKPARLATAAELLNFTPENDQSLTWPDIAASYGQKYCDDSSRTIFVDAVEKKITERGQ